MAEPFCFQGSLQATLDQLQRPQPPIPPPPPRGPGYRLIAAGLLLALPTLGLSLVLVARGRRLLAGPPLPRRIEYALDRSGYSIDSQKLSTLLDFLLALRHDLDEEKKLSLEIDFTSAMHEKFLLERKENGPRQRSRYRQTWLKLKLPLRVGGKLQISVYRSVHAKIKRKRRHSKQHLVMQDFIWVSSGQGCAPFQPPLGLIWKASGVLATAPGHYREARGIRVLDSREQLLDARRLLAACIAFANAAPANV